MPRYTWSSIYQQSHSFYHKLLSAEMYFYQLLLCQHWYLFEISKYVICSMSSLFLYNDKNNKPPNNNAAKLRLSNYLENCIFTSGIMNVFVASAFRFHTQLDTTWRPKYLSSTLPNHKLRLCLRGSSQNVKCTYNYEIFPRHPGICFCIYSRQND